MLIPLMIRWPAVIAAGRTSDDMVSTIDLFRTVLGALEISVPRDASARGRDFSPLLRGQSIPRRDTVFGQYDLHNSGLAYMRMIRTARHKLVRHFHANMLDELYDLEHDSGETKNLAGVAGHNAIQRQLRGELEKWMTSVDDPLLRDPY